MTRERIVLILELSDWAERGAVSRALAGAASSSLTGLGSAHWAKELLSRSGQARILSVSYDGPALALGDIKQ